jgi:hypothetical protein
MRPSKVLLEFPLEMRDPDWTSVQMTADGKSVAVSWSEGDMYRAIRDGRPFPAIRCNTRLLEWAPGFEKAAWVSDEGGVVFVVDSAGTRRGPYKKAWFASDCFSRRGLRLAYAALDGSEGYVHVDGKTYGPYDEVQAPSFDGDSEIARWRCRRGDEWFLQTEARSYGPFTKPPVELQASGSAPLLAFEWDARHWLFVNDREIGPFFGETPRAALSVGGEHLAIAHGERGARIVELDGTSLGTFGNLVALAGSSFSPDGKRLSFGYFKDLGIGKGGEHGFFLDGARHDGFAYADGPVWSNDSRRVAWGIAEDWQHFGTFIDGKIERVDIEIDWETADHFLFSPDGRFCFSLNDREHDQVIVRLGKKSLKVGQLEAPSHTSACALFSRDGSVFAVGGDFGKTGHSVQWTGGRVGPFDLLDYALTPDGDLVLAVWQESTGMFQHLILQA